MVGEFAPKRKEGWHGVMDKQLAALFQLLTEALKEEFACLTRLLDVIGEETLALRDSRLPEAIDIGIRKGDAFRQSEAAAEQRVDAVAKIVAHLHLEDCPSFIELAPYAADVITRQILTGCRDKFTDIGHRIRRANETNRRIIALTLSRVGDNIHFIMKIRSSLPNYDRHGQISARRLQGEFISQAG